MIESLCQSEGTFGLQHQGCGRRLVHRVSPVVGLGLDGYLSVYQQYQSATRLSSRAMTSSGMYLRKSNFVTATT
jgi:hypothetical protein